MQALSGIAGTESSSFWEHWNLIKNRIGELLNLGGMIKNQWNRAKRLRDKATDAETIEALDEKLYQWSNMYQTWKEVQAKIMEWRSTWQRVEQSVEKLLSTGTLGVVPLVLPAWALTTLAAGGLAALAFVSTQGLSLLKQYQLEKSVLDKLERGVISAQQASDVFEAVKPASTFTFGGMGTGMLVGALALVGFLWYQK